MLSSLLCSPLNIFEWKIPNILLIPNVIWKISILLIDTYIVIYTLYAILK